MFVKFKKDLKEGGPVKGTHMRDPEDVKSRQLFVGNLPYTMTWQSLKDIFREFGDVQRVSVPEDKYVSPLFINLNFREKAKAKHLCFLRIEKMLYMH